MKNNILLVAHPTQPFKQGLMEIRRKLAATGYGIVVFFGKKLPTIAKNFNAVIVLGDGLLYLKDIVELRKQGVETLIFYIFPETRPGLKNEQNTFFLWAKTLGKALPQILRVQLNEQRKKQRKEQPNTVPTEEELTLDTI